MSLPNNIQYFGFEIFKEIEMELEKFKNIYPYSNQNDIYNAVVTLCITRIREIAEAKRRDIENRFWD